MEDTQKENRKALEAELTMMKIKEWLECQVRRIGSASTVEKAKDFVSICEALLKNKNKTLST